MSWHMVHDCGAEFDTEEDPKVAGSIYCPKEMMFKPFSSYKVSEKAKKAEQSVKD